MLLLSDNKFAVMGVASCYKWPAAEHPVPVTGLKSDTVVADMTLVAPIQDLSPLV